MDPAGPKPVASVRGTTICAEDMFYNVPTRKKVKGAMQRQTGKRIKGQGNAEATRKIVKGAMQRLFDLVGTI